MYRLGARRTVSLEDVTGGEIRKVAFVGNYLPRKCGIANFTHDLRCAVASRYPDAKAVVVCVDDDKEPYAYPPEVTFEFQEQEAGSYLRAADYINASSVDVVCVQHEYGIYGGACGMMLLNLLREVKVPIVTTFHTILQDPSPDQRRILNALIQLSSRVITMTATGCSLLKKVFNAPMEKVDVIAHGIPDRPFVASNEYKERFGLQGKRVLLTFGLLSPNKGIEYMIRAMPEIVKEFPDTVYVILGQTHPNLIRENGEAYRFSLEFAAKELGVQDNIQFVNRYTDLDLLTQYIGACDVYVTPYLHEAQITSGTLSYAFGIGKAVVSTRYWHARDLLGNELGKLVDFRDSEQLSASVLELLRSPELLASMQRKAYDVGRTMTWPRTAEKYQKCFQNALVDRQALVQRQKAMGVQIKSPVSSVAASGSYKAPFAAAPASPASLFKPAFPVPLPEIRLVHLMRMIDRTGIAQHATFDLPNWDHGYCTDDVARALMVLVRLRTDGYPLESEHDTAITTMMCFLFHSFTEKRGRFNNFMSFDRQFTDPAGVGSEDSHGRAMMALGMCVRFGVHTEVATQLFQWALPATEHFTSPRAWAFVLHGICQFRERIWSDPEVCHFQEKLSNQLVAMYRHNSSEEWKWFEDIVAYQNAIIAQSLLYCSLQMDNAEQREIGLETLTWLLKIQDVDGVFTPIGSEGFYRKNEHRALYDQQPIEASDLVQACVKALEVTRDTTWSDTADHVFNWFMGKNHLGVPLFDSKTGGCHDGLHRHRMNENQGAESTICFVDALACLRTAHEALAEKENVEELLHQDPHAM